MYLHPTQPQFLVEITHKLSNKHYHHHTANLGTNSVAISRTTFSPKQPPWTSDHKPIDLTTPIPHLLMPLSTPHVHTRAGNYRHSAGRQEWRTCGAHTRLTRPYFELREEHKWLRIVVRGLLSSGHWLHQRQQRYCLGLNRQTGVQDPQLRAVGSKKTSPLTQCEQSHYWMNVAEHGLTAWRENRVDRICQEVKKERNKVEEKVTHYVSATCPTG
jgi:hypothetical protein